MTGAFLYRHHNRVGRFSGKRERVRAIATCNDKPDEYFPPHSARLHPHLDQA